MNKLADLELCIMSCVILKPELMKEIKFEDKHIVKHQRLWIFLKTFYERFGKFDIQLMYSLDETKIDFENFIMRVGEIEVNTINFDLYQERLIEKYEQSLKDDFLIKKIYELSNKLYVHSITLNDFNKKLSEIYEMADKSFK